MKLNHRWDCTYHPYSKEECKGVVEDSAEVILNCAEEGMAEGPANGTMKNATMGKLEGIMEGRRERTREGNDKEGGTVQGEVKGMWEKMVRGIYKHMVMFVCKGV